MTIFVDDMHAAPVGRYGRMKMSHMIGPEAELHALAGRIGVARRWYQGDHYDICLTKRALAVAAGAVEVTMRQLACMSRRHKVTGDFGKPEEAEAWVKVWWTAKWAEAEAVA